MKRYWIPATLMLWIALVLAGCGGQTTAPATSEPTKPSAVPKRHGADGRAYGQGRPTAVPTSTPAPDPTVVGEDLTLDSRDVGLDELKSYRVAYWKADWETTKDGKTDRRTRTGSWSPRPTRSAPLLSGREPTQAVRRRAVGSIGRTAATPAM